MLEALDPESEGRTTVHVILIASLASPSDSLSICNPAQSLVYLSYRC